MPWKLLPPTDSTCTAKQSQSACCASRLAERLGRVDADFTSRQRRLLSALGLPVGFPNVDRDAFVAAMAHDKKVEHGKLRFVLPTRMGHVELVSGVAEHHVRTALDD